MRLSVLLPLIAAVAVGCTTDTDEMPDSGNDGGDGGDDSRCDLMSMGGIEYVLQCPLGEASTELDARWWQLYEGLRCEEEGADVFCRTFTPRQDVCYAGLRRCTDGVWGSCDATTPLEPGSVPPEGAATGVRREAMLGEIRECRESCERRCFQFYDCPSDPDFNGENSENLRYDVVNRELPAGVVVASSREEGRFTRRMEASCADGPPLWWNMELYAWPAEPDPAQPQEVVLRVRTAETEAELLTLTESDWQTVVECPSQHCAVEDREDPSLADVIGPNLVRVLGLDAGRRPWLEYQVLLKRNGAEESPRFIHIVTRFLCEP
jgi:hypothetical protein